MCTSWLPRWYQRIQVMGLKEEKFLISRDVIFDEDVFPFKSQPNVPNDDDNQVTFIIEDEAIDSSIYQSETKINEYNDTKITSSNVHEIDQSLGCNNIYPGEETIYDPPDVEPSNFPGEESGNVFPEEEILYNLQYSNNKEDDD